VTLQDQQELLGRVAQRIRTFAEAQRASISEMSIKIPGGTAGHTISACHTAGCYAPGGRYPLPSSVLMTAITARVAGVACVVVASPRPAAITLAAAYVAGADHLLAVGGAQAIAAMAYGASASVSAAACSYFPLSIQRDRLCILSCSFADVLRPPLPSQTGVGSVPSCHVIVGPGNRWVTAAKSLLSGICAIDMLAGPSECLVLADETANAAVRK
jgi:histidinol dehydrogenase